MKKIYIVPFILLTILSCKKEEKETIVIKKNDYKYSPDNIKKVLDKEQKAIFQYFYDGADPDSALAYEGNERNDGAIITIGGSGFGLMALVVGVERGFINREQALERVLKSVRFLGKAERFKGFWSHWYNKDGTSHAFGNQVKAADAVETSFMVAGLLSVYQYFNLNNSSEQELRDSVDSFWNTIQWNDLSGDKNHLHWIWHSQENRLELPIKGWNESLETYLFALAAPDENKISQEVYNGWLSQGSAVYPNRNYYGYNLPLGPELGGPLFFAHYSFLGFNPKQMSDNNVNYWKQNQAHAMINRHYCIYQAPKNNSYNAQNWGLTACYGAGTKNDYLARSPSQDDGIIAPTASLASFPYTPFYSAQVLLNLTEKSEAHGKYGFCDSYQPSTSSYQKKHLAIDQGPIVVMIENYRSGFIWNLFAKDQRVKTALQRAAITPPNYQEGFHLAVKESETKVYDMLAHPDRKKYELDFYCSNATQASFIISDSENKIILDTLVNALAGENVFSFPYDDRVWHGKKHNIKLKLSSEKEFSLDVNLR